MSFKPTFNTILFNDANNAFAYYINRCISIYWTELKSIFNNNLKKNQKVYQLIKYDDWVVINCDVIFSSFITKFFKDFKVKIH